jgi:hypothetical protein
MSAASTKLGSDIATGRKRDSIDQDRHKAPLMLSYANLDCTWYKCPALPHRMDATHIQNLTWHHIHSQEQQYRWFERCTEPGEIGNKPSTCTAAADVVVTGYNSSTRHDKEVQLSVSFVASDHQRCYTSAAQLHPNLNSIPRPDTSNPHLIHQYPAKLYPICSKHTVLLHSSLICVAAVAAPCSLLLLPHHVVGMSGLQ